METVTNIIVVILLSIVASVYLLGFINNLRVVDSPNWKLFYYGEMPSLIPSGFHKGSVSRFQGTWKGKEFDHKNSSGINIFSENGKEVEKYPFKLYIGKGISNPGHNVLKIDYNIPQNPFWVRFILDELVKIPAQKNGDYYLGQINLTLPFYNIVLGYFRLEK